VSGVESDGDVLDDDNACFMFLGIFMDSICIVA